MANNFKTTIELSAQSPSGNLLYTTLELPATRGEITDAAHRLRNLPVSEIVITGSDALPELADTRLDAPTVDELNFFASRVNALPDDELAALGGVFLHRGNLGEFEDGLTMKDLINMTYGLDGVMIAPNVANDEQLGQFVIDNEMNDDIAALSDEIIELLDRERVGRRQRENEGGEFMNGRYVVAGGFESPEVYDGITLPAEEAFDAVFRLHIAAPDAEEGATVAVELPMTQESIDLFALEHDGQPIGNFVVVNMESGIPQITGSQFGSMDNFVLLNGIAQAYSEMNVGERMTFKAALQAQGGLPGDLSDILETAESVREYELAAFVSDEAEFFKEYLAHSLPTDFDVRWLDTLAISTDSLHLLERLGATITDYGILSARGESLYKSIPFSAPDADEAETQELTNDGEISDESESTEMSEDGSDISADNDIPTEDGAEISADNDNPTEDRAEITDDNIPTEDGTEIPDESESADMTEDDADISVDNDIPTEDGTEIPDESESTDMTEDNADISVDNDIPTEDGTEIPDESESADMKEDSADISVDNDIPTEDGTEITDEDIPTEDDADISEDNAELTTDDVLPTEDGAELTDEDIPTEDGTEITDKDIPTEDGVEITDEEILTEDEAELTADDVLPVEDGGEFPFDEGEGACFPVEDDEIPSFCFGEDDQDDDESEDEDEDEDEDYEAYMGGMTF
ncbi:MAG: hypothetical protein IJL03_07855 [Lachnospiraceae bacterium]|nr:hypothetical protein [Lachnospiraceae bacterium]